MCIMWDANHATSPGPDTADVQIAEGDGYGESNFACTSFNGPDVGLATGFFCFDPGLAILQPVPSDSSWYYIKICATDCQWYSASFPVLSGPSDVHLTPSGWTCSDSGCSFGADSESSRTESNENAMSWTFEDLMLGDSARGLTIYFDAAANELILRWPSVCAQAYQAYKVYSSTSANGPFTTLVATTTDTSLTFSLPTGPKQFYTVVAYTDWDQIGIDHNRGLSYAYARFMQAGLDTTWSLEVALDTARNITLDFIRDSTCYDSKYASAALNGEIETAPSLDSALMQLDTLMEAGVISSQEALYLTRLYTLLCDTNNLPDSVFTDSLNTFVEDVLAVSWNEDEVFCLAITSVAAHSLVYWSESGWGYSPNASLGAYVAADAFMAGAWLFTYVRSGAWAVGGIWGGVATGAAGAIYGSLSLYLVTTCADI